ncbi:hypothetical protein EYZ11_000278 [Aspergillus tanneri]|uniref:Pseudouridine synthase I TruA alpha/beta domain-containing protein n=1 Tax=Aspergillus tanneri TaxID=1220188 RepID=A0A4S3JXP5_9EURO|nr:uncharacterized protein ATNIH1004_007869 [Aspergillus tanneri]KAA8646439.1 hypothetical protein ATNIH1004_007869 [Aspergillus tanneri]THD00228.1 hypothetical protein EYZ11_000278 [Aspergillus tanneri]
MSSGAGEPFPAQGHAQETQPDYTTWDTPSLISRITELERQLHSRTAEYATGTVSGEQQQLQQQHGAVFPNKKAKKRASESDDITKTRAHSRPPKEAREIDPSKYNTRFIALKFAYLGQRYNGLEHTNGNVTPLPTIEEEMWKALRRTRLILPQGATNADEEFGDPRKPRALKPYSLNWDGCQYSKAGRTDRGVSAFGQVIGIRIRSARPKKKDVALSTADTTMQDGNETSGLTESAADDNWDDIADELPYISMLNRVLPEDIRVLAWCPHPPKDFDARFSCRERQYKYFFTQPAFFPTPGLPGFAPRAENTRPKYREGYLDIDAMRQAAKYFEGVHDFRNFCKLDTSKQIENFERIIYYSDIELLDTKSNPLGHLSRPGFQPLESSVDQGPESPGSLSSKNPQVYTFSLQGSAFLWHQVRHMVSILFLVGQGLEPPSIVAELLDVSKNPAKPSYEMASDAPLVLWDCIFPDLNSGTRQDALEWIYAGDPRQMKSQSGKGSGKFGLGSITDGLWSVWRQRKIDEVLAGALLDLSISQGDQRLANGEFTDAGVDKQNRGQKVFYGGNETRVGGKYIPVMQKRRNDPVEVQNARWRATKQRKAGKVAEAEQMEL